MSTILQLQKSQSQLLSQLAQAQQYKCLQCNKTFNKLGHFNRHMNERHTDNRTYICKELDCGKTFKRGSHLKRHMISHTNQKGFKCTRCIMSFGYKHHLERHVKLIHLRERLECLQCDLEFIKRKAFNKHNAKFHGEHSTQIQPQEGVSKKSDMEEMKVEKTMTKMGEGMEESIFQSESEGILKAESQRQLYRCCHPDCLSAFYGFYEFKRHLAKIHAQK